MSGAVDHAAAGSLLVRGADTHAGDVSVVVDITPESAGWSYVGFSAVRLAPGGELAASYPGREACIVVIEGTCDVVSSAGTWEGVGGRTTPFEGRPDSVYLPAGAEFRVRGGGAGAEVGICTAPRNGAGAPARLLPGDSIEPEHRGSGTHSRTIHPILMEDEPADSLLVCEVITPPGNWSSYPPHKHDRDDLPNESFLEETYYHRVRPSHGFGLQRVYTAERDLDESLAFGDGDAVLVPRGYHAVAAPPGYAVYYLNVMAGPTRRWAINNDPDHSWLL